MAVKLTLLQVVAPAGAPREAYVLITPTGNYVALGDTMDLTTLFGQVGADGATIDSDQLPIDAGIESLTGGWGASGGGYYVAQLYTNANPPVAKALNLCLFRAFAAGGAEEGAGAYDATIKNDRIIMKLTYSIPQ